MRNTIGIILCSHYRDVLSHWQTVLEQLIQLKLPGLAKLESAEIQCIDLLSEAPELIRSDETSQSGYIVLSDQFVSETHDDCYGRLMEYVNDLPCVPVVNVSLAPVDRQHDDIDATLPIFGSQSESISKLRMVIRKLSYLIPPRSISRRKINVNCRLLETVEEFRSALRLRKYVYETMGYLDMSFLDTRTSLELNWFDFNSFHFGAFVKSSNGDEKLVGSARLILTKPSIPQSRDWCSTILAANRPLRKLICREREQMAPYKLPAFRSLTLTEQMRDAARSARPWSELSRVIVKPQWRGRGYSQVIIEEVIRFAILKGVEIILLECLEIHARMYEGHGFSGFGQKATIVGVGRTMVGMEKHLVPASSKKVTNSAPLHCGTVGATR